MGFDELTEEFAREAEDLLERLEKSLLALEAQVDPQQREHTAHDIRRTLHTLKGNSGLLGAFALQAALHAMEDAAHDLAHAPQHVAWLLFAADAVGAEVRDLKAGRAIGEVSGAVRALVSGVKPASGSSESDAHLVALDDDVRVPRQRLDGLLAAAGELMVINSQLQRAGAGGSTGATAWLDRLDRTARLLHELVIKTRTLRMGAVSGRFVRLVRDEAQACGKEAQLVVEGNSVEVDRMVLQIMLPPLMHLVRNAVVHGLEAPAEREAHGKQRRGTILLDVAAVGDRVHLTISDDGRGLDREAILRRARELGMAENLAPEQAIFLPGFSTAKVTASAGRGVGLDVVARALSSLAGTLEVRSSPGLGTTFLLSVPASLALERAVLVGVADEVFAIPASSVMEAIRYSPSIVRVTGHGRYVEHAGTLLPLADTEATLCVRPRSEGYLLLLRQASAVALRVDRLLGQQDFVFQPLDQAIRGAGPASGAALQGDGRVLLRLDPDRLAGAAMSQVIQ